MKIFLMIIMTIIIIIILNYKVFVNTVNISNNYCHKLEYLSNSMEKSIKNNEKDIEIIYWIKDDNLEEFLNHVNLKPKLKYLFYSDLNDIANNNTFSFNSYFQKGEERLIYVSRGNSKRRKIINEDYLIDKLKQKIKNIEILRLDKYTLVQQGKLFSNCKLFISLHGASISNYHFMPKKSNIIELIPGNQSYHSFDIKIKNMGIDYHPLYLENYVKSEECYNLPRDSFVTIEEKNINTIYNILDNIGI